MMTITEKRKREDAVAEDRASGMTWKEVGEKHGLSANRARQITQIRRNRLLRDEHKDASVAPTFLDLLTVRTRNCLFAEDLRNEGDVRKYIDSNGAEALYKIPNMGPRSANEVLQALGLPAFNPRRKRVSEGSIKGAITLLARAGYKVEKA